MKNFQSETNIWRFTPLIGMTSKGFPRGLISYFLLFLPLEFTYHLCFRTPKGLLRMGTSTSYGCRNVILMSNKWMFLFDRSRSLLIIYSPSCLHGLCYISYCFINIFNHSCIDFSVIICDVFVLFRVLGGNLQRTMDALKW